ncbi:hypothetical protein RB595_005618 [Gaeumannomyces hyphopodioides]
MACTTTTTLTQTGEMLPAMQVQVQSPSLPDSDPGFSNNADLAATLAISAGSAIPDGAKDPSPPSTHRNWHAHRQSHNSSKLPAFRFADLKATGMGKESTPLPGLPLPQLQRHHQKEEVDGEEQQQEQPQQQQQQQKQQPAQAQLEHRYMQKQQDGGQPWSPSSNGSTTTYELGTHQDPLDGDPTDQDKHPHHLQSADHYENPAAAAGSIRQQSATEAAATKERPHVPPRLQLEHRKIDHNSHNSHHPSDGRQDPSDREPESTLARTTPSVGPQPEKPVSPQPTPIASAPTCASVAGSASTSSDHANNSINTNNSVATHPSPVGSASSTTRLRCALSPRADRPAASTIARPNPVIRRPYSFPDSPAPSRVASEGSRVVRANSKSPPSSSPTVQLGPSHHRRANTDSSAGAITATTITTAPHAVDVDHGDIAASPGTITKEWARGQRELLLPRALDDDNADEKRKFKSRPPVSFRRLRNDSSGIRVPPIRSFRSSGSRKSWTQDLTTPTPKRNSLDDCSREVLMDSDTHDRNRTLWALEGRLADGAFAQMTPPSSADATLNDNTTSDIFMKIAREDSSRSQADGDRQPQDPNALSRVNRSAHRRPLSAAIPSYQRTSPPRVSRRLSDQRETSRSHRSVVEQPTLQMPKDQPPRPIAKERVVQLDDTPRSRLTSQALKGSPITPRSPAAQDTPDPISAYARRRTSVTDNATPPTSRTSSFKATYGQARTYNSSPLVPRHAEAHQAEAGGQGHAVEGTESSTSTAAPSTVWDELDDIRTRIHRLGLTGKAPATSNHAMSRVSDDRPPTATTNATTMSGSPKRSSGNAKAESVSATSSSHRESNNPILISAVTKSKPFLSAEAYEALEAAATDALALSQMMGAPGQPGPISSSASSIGFGTNLTDRQLRKKADSVCRNLTELCLALADNGGAAAAKTAPVKNVTVATSTPKENEIFLTSPTARTFSFADGPRRSGAVGEGGLARLNTTLSPRSLGRTSDRRSALLGGGTLSSPRFALTSATPIPSIEPVSAGMSAGRKSSLLISRTRRAGTEEPEEMSGRRSSLLRTRRAGTEEPDEGRKTSFFRRGSQKPYDDEDDAPLPRAPSRATTELGLMRNAPRDYVGQQQQKHQHQQHHQQTSSISEPSNLGSSALPRRRLVPSSLNARLVAPPAPSRRYLERVTPERDVAPPVGDKMADERVQRQFSLIGGAAGTGSTIGRTGSLNRRRDSLIPGLGGVASGSQVGGYR